MKARMLLMSMLFALVLCLGATVHAQESNSMSETEALMQADRDWSKAAESKNWEAFFDGFADDAVMMAPDAPIADGKAAVRALVQTLIEMPGFTVKWQPTNAFVSESGDLGYTFGTDVMTMNDPDGNLITDNGKYATVWRKDADGTWKVVLDMFNSAEPKTSGNGE